MFFRDCAANSAGSGGSKSHIEEASILDMPGQHFSIAVRMAMVGIAL